MFLWKVVSQRKWQGSTMYMQVLLMGMFLYVCTCPGMLTHTHTRLDNNILHIICTHIHIHCNIRAYTNAEIKIDWLLMTLADVFQYLRCAHTHTHAWKCRDVNTLTADDVKRLPWFFALEISPLALGGMLSHAHTCCHVHVSCPYFYTTHTIIYEPATHT